MNSSNAAPAWPAIEPKDLDGRVLGDWRVSVQRAASVEYVVGVWRQFVRCVYKPAPMPQRIGRFLEREGESCKQIWKVRFAGKRSSMHAQEWCHRSIAGVGANGERKVWTKFPPQRGSTYLPATAEQQTPKK